MSLSVSPNDLELARQISRDARDNPDSPYARKYVVILDGEVVLIAGSPEEGIQELGKIDPDRQRGLLIDAGVDYDAVHDIWVA
jgi:hypothetical protein